MRYDKIQEAALALALMVKEQKEMGREEMIDLLEEVQSIVNNSLWELTA